MEKDQNRLMTASEVGEEFRVDRRTVVRWAKEGKIDFIRTIGGHYRFPLQAVKALRKKVTHK